jgi:hypothetical protein
MALTTVDALNTYLGETDTSDAKTAAVSAAISFVTRYCGRAFEAARYREWRELPGARYCLLSDAPVTAIYRCAAGTTGALAVSYSGDATVATITVSNDACICYAWTGDGVTPETTIDFASLSDPTIASLAEAINSLSGWSAIVERDGDVYWLRPVWTQDVLNRTARLEMAGDDVDGYVVDTVGGLVSFGGTVAGPIYLDYYAGYASTELPAEIQQLATEIAAYIYRSSSLSHAVQSERIGDYAYQIRDDAELVTQFAARLAPWRRRSL